MEVTNDVTVCPRPMCPETKSLMALRPLENVSSWIMLPMDITSQLFHFNQN
jgi:hypothetical protein